MPELRDKRVDLILQQLDDLPTLPGIALRVLEATGNDSSSAQDVIRLIESDPSLTARILQLIHRAGIGAGSEIATVERAVVLLGFDAVRMAVLAISVFQTFQETPGSAAFNREDFWKHCVGVASCCELLATAPTKSQDHIDSSEAFVCGLLHDIGKVALDAMLPKSFARVVQAADLLRGDIAELERTIIGLDHLVVGKRLAEMWRLPANVRDCAWLHGQIPEALPASVHNKRLVNIVTLADQIVREQHIGFSGNHAVSILTQTLLDAIGITSAQVSAILPKLMERIEVRAEALGLGQANATQLYQQALSQANRELGRAAEQLATRNKKLAVRARFFEALSAFQSELRPDAPPQDVLHAIGQTAVSVLDVTSAAIFSLPPGRDYAEALLVDGAGEIFETTLVETEKDAKTQAEMTRHPGDGPVQAVGSQLEWFITAVSPRLGHENRYWICLEADGACIGGIVWGAPVGEAQRLGSQVQELSAIATGWSLALRTAQIREESRVLSEQLADANRQLQTAQAEMLRKRTVITVGEMAAGAAHEMNNPLAVISGRSQLLASTLSDPKHKAMAHLIHEQSDRLSQIISELMDFAKPVPPRVVESDLAELVQRAIHEAKALPEHADSTIEVTFGDVPAVSVDPNQIGAALLEVIDNALQATAEVKSPRVEVHATVDPYSSRVVLSVSDNGNGMDELTLKRAFDPFFSSKPAGRRRGMGLAKALRWIESSGGSMRLESHPDQGTRALILLPAAKSETKVERRTARKQA